MKRIMILILTVFSGLAQAIPAKSWECSGFDLIEEGILQNGEALTFNLVLSEYDGKDFQWKAMENIVYASGKTAADIELMQKTVVCGKDDEGKDRVGPNIWSLDVATGRFLLYSGCENERTIVEGTCK